MDNTVKSPKRCEQCEKVFESLEESFQGFGRESNFCRDCYEATLPSDECWV